jgi:hypothetical protein
LFEQVSRDAAWLRNWEADGIQVVCLTGKSFRDQVTQTREEFTLYLGQLNVTPVEGGPVVRTLSHGGTLAAIAAANLILALAVALGRARGFWRGRLIPLAVFSLCIPLLAETWRFPPATEGVGAAAAPRLWLSATALCALLAAVMPGPTATDVAVKTDVGVVAKWLLVVFVQWWATSYVGYYLSALIGTWVMLRLLGERRWMVLASVTLGWLACASLLFHRLLHVDLPTGKWFE